MLNIETGSLCDLIFSKWVKGIVLKNTHIFPRSCCLLTWKVPPSYTLYYDWKNFAGRSLSIVLRRTFCWQNMADRTNGKRYKKAGKMVMWRRQSSLDAKQGKQRNQHKRCRNKKKVQRFLHRGKPNRSGYMCGKKTSKKFKIFLKLCMAIVKLITIGYSFSTNQKSSNIVQILKLFMSHAHNRPLISCRVSKRTGKHGLFLGLWATLFYGFFCLNMLHSSQMWLVCLLLVRSIFQVFFRRCFGESLHRLPLRHMVTNNAKPRRSIFI